jgi:hypothetical protein
MRLRRDPACSESGQSRGEEDYYYYYYYFFVCSVSVHVRFFFFFSLFCIARAFLLIA